MCNCASVEILNVREIKCKCCQSTLSGPTRGTWALTFSGFGENHTKWLFSYSVQNTFCFNYHLFDLQWLQWGQRPKILMLTIWQQPFPFLRNFVTIYNNKPVSNNKVNVFVDAFLSDKSFNKLPHSGLYLFLNIWA